MTPEPFASRERATLVSPPVAFRNTPFPVAAFPRVSSFTADATESRTSNSLPFASARKPRSANFGVVSVGEVPKTRAPVPVSSVIAVIKLADVSDIPYPEKV
jgi:hypothetical protein